MVVDPHDMSTWAGLVKCNRALAMAQGMISAANLVLSNIRINFDYLGLSYITFLYILKACVLVYISSIILLLKYSSIKH